jgi:hypothetical protein
VVSTPQARIYVPRGRDRYDSYAYRACSYRYGRRVRLMTEDVASLLGGVAVNRRFVVFGEERYCDIGGCLYEVFERSLRTGRIRFSAINGACPDTPEGDCGQAVIRRPLLRRDGAVAWLACPGSTATPFEADDECTESYAHEVLVHDRHGNRTLDHGHIRAASLRFLRHGRRVEWVRRGERRSARLY